MAQDEFKKRKLRPRSQIVTPRNKTGTGQKDAGKPGESDLFHQLSKRVLGQRGNQSSRGFNSPPREDPHVTHS